MTITVNGETREVEPNVTIEQLLEQIGAPHRGIAVAKNDTVIRREHYSTQHVRDGDRIEIIRAVAGG